MQDKLKNINIKGRVWLNIGEESFIGHGKIELLEKIKELGSLRKAAIDMKMSYQKAWSSINETNKLLDSPLVILKRGGKDGGIAQITETGEKIINLYKELQIEFKHFLTEKSNHIKL